MRWTKRDRASTPSNVFTCAAPAGLLGGGAAPTDRFERLRTRGEWREEARRLASSSTQMGFRTSASTGRPEPTLHDRAELEEGDGPKAFVVPADATADERDLRAALDRFVRENFAPAVRPRVWRFGPFPPVDEHGTPVDWSIEPV